MNCPICPGHTLEACFSQGIEIDVCRNCSGVWLDRGELDKLIDAARPSSLLAASSSAVALQDSVDASDTGSERTPAKRKPKKPKDSKKKRDSKEYKKDKKKRKKKPKSWGDRLEDIFDDVLDL